MSTPAQAPKVRSFYRRILRELPARQTRETILSNPSVLQRQIRSHMSSEPSPDKSLHAQLDEMEQYVQYIKAQRMYTTLLERYNPGMDMSEEERVRLSARRVGMNLPDEFLPAKKD